MTDQIGFATLFLTACVFPFVLYFFKKNERLHEETRNKVGDHETTLAIHTVKIESLEMWRNMHNPAVGVTQTTTTTAVNP
jgi:hypothetical protein